MIMIKLLKNISNDDGYSFIEVFVAVILIGIISTIIYINGSQITDSITQGKNSLNKKFDLISLKLILKDESQKVRTPWFNKEYLYKSSENELILYYYNGNKDKYLKMETTDYGVKISSDTDIIYSSDKLTGTFSLKGSYITYKDEDRTFIFPLGVILA